jgi:hydroxyethylthiazole kinase-like uncharacterized protein yjeF
MKIFTSQDLSRLYRPNINSQGEDNGQVVVIGGSRLFHGAPLMAVKAASRVSDMVFFSSPEKTLEGVVSQIKASILSFIWVPWKEIDSYIQKADAILIGPGFLRFSSEEADHHQRTVACDEACQLTKKISEELLTKYKDKKWVIDAGSLQVISPKFIPQGAIVTPNRREFKQLFGVDINEVENTKKIVKLVETQAKKHRCVILFKGPTGVVSNGTETYAIEGGNPGLTKGGVGDTLAGLTVGLLAKNEPLLAASAASFLLKAAADRLFKEKGTYYSAEDLSNALSLVISA